ncbi:hypothetical protein [Enterococcus sp. HY326]|uniref:hypothetical protein n=1 Tax=Enterococcus sp. HY326 TaxID=2971265 RepID=UPI00223F1515|nr:hypothetical protein [Enterococcus sp. HY326]
MTNIEIGNYVYGQPIGLKESILGRVEHVYDKTVAVNVMEYAPRDEIRLIDLQFKVLVRIEEIENVSTGVTAYQVAT